MNRKRLRGLLQIGISVLLLVLILRQVQWREARAALLQMDLRWLALGWVLFLLGIAVRAVRWQALLHDLGIRRPVGELVARYFVGGFFNVLLPTGFGGDAVRAMELAQDTSRLGAAVNSVLVDRYLGIIVLLAMGVGAGLVLPGAAPAGVFWATAALLAGGLLAAYLLRRPGWAALAGREDLAGRLVRLSRLHHLAEATAPYGRRGLGIGLLASLGFNLLQIAWNAALAMGLGLHLPLGVFMAFIPLTAVALLLPAFGGLGVRELTYVGLFGGAGVPQAAALALSLSVYLLTLSAGLAGGLVYLIQGVRRIRT